MTGVEGAALAALGTGRGTGAVAAHQVSEEEIVMITGGDAEGMIHMIVTVTIAMLVMVDVIVTREATGKRNNRTNQEIFFYRFNQSIRNL